MFGKELDVNRKGGDRQPMYSSFDIKIVRGYNNRVHIIMSQFKWKNDTMKNRCDSTLKSADLLEPAIRINWHVQVAI